MPEDYYGETYKQEILSIYEELSARGHERLLGLAYTLLAMEDLGREHRASIVAQAQSQYNTADGNVGVEGNALILECHGDGYWVEAWVWIDNPDRKAEER